MGQQASKPGPPTTRMQVLGLGMSRTGTASFSAALEILLDAPVYHTGAQLVHGSSAHMHRWVEITRRFPLSADPGQAAKDKAVVRSLLKRQLSGFAAVTDTPTIQFAEELVELYPDTLVIVTTRDPEKWWRSIEPVTNNAVNGWLGLVFWPVPGLRWWKAMVDAHTVGRWGELYYYKGETKPDVFVYERHMEHVERVVPRGKLHYYDVREGWEPLCRILGKPVPDVPFPHINDAESAEKVFVDCLKVALLYWAGIFGAAAVGGAVLWRWFR